MTVTALAGVRVLEIADGWSPASLAGRLLGELGAEVAKVEGPSGDTLRADLLRAPDGESLAFHLVGATKRSVVLDGRGAAWRHAFERLLAWADIVVIDAHGANVVRAGGLAIEDVCHAWPELIVCAITPFGLAGPLGDWSAGEDPSGTDPPLWRSILARSELMVQATSGVMASTGYAHRPPTRAGVPLGAHVGALTTTTSVLAALRTRESGEPGQLIDLSVHDGLVTCLGTFLPAYFLTGRSPGRVGNRHTMAVPWNAYPCRDGWAMICTANERQWASLVEVIGGDDLRKDPRYATLDTRLQHVDAVDAALVRFTADRSVADVVATLDAADVPAGSVARVEDLIASPHFAARQMLVDVPGANGVPVRTIGPLFKMTRTPGRVGRRAPALGEATDELLGATPAARRPFPCAAPLERLRILEMAAFTAGPAGVRLLGSLGCDVVKIEPPHGEPGRRLPQRLGRDSYLFHVNNTDKRSVTLDVTTGPGRRTLLELVRSGDAFVENFAPGTTRAWGIDADSLMAENPRLVYCSISGFGQHGPLGSKPAYDTVVQAVTGVMALTGYAGDPPVKVGLSMADLLGSCLAPAAILAALRHRDLTGEGQHVDVSLFDVAAWTTAVSWPSVLADQATRAGDPPAVVSATRRPFDGTAAPGYGVYEARNGRPVAIETLDEGQWSRLAGMPDHPAQGHGPADAASTSGRRRTVEAGSAVAAWVASRDVNDVVSACRAAGIAAAPVLTVGEVAEHPQTREREMVVTRDHAELGPVRLLGTPLKLSRPSGRVRRVAPALGAHNAEVLGA